MGTSSSKVNKEIINKQKLVIQEQNIQIQMLLLGQD